MAPPIVTGSDPETYKSGKLRKHIYDWDKPEFTVNIQGDLVEFKRHKEWIPPKNRRKRERITGFSRQARFRLLKFGCTIDFKRSGFSVLITLTYPDRYFRIDKDTRNMHRAHFVRKLETYLGIQVKGLWRVEWVPRQTGMNVGEFMPHFHLLLYGLPFVPWQRINEWWKSVIHEAGDVATDIRGAKSKRQSGLYLSKYVAKECGNVSLSLHHISPIDGRHYGYLHKWLIPRHKTHTVIDLDEKTRKELLDLALGIDPFRGSECEDSFTLLWDRATVAKRILAQNQPKTIDDPFSIG